MKNRIINLILIVSISISFSFLSSCEKETYYPPSNTDELYSIMNEWYYWIDSIPDIDPDNYSSPDDLLEAMRYNDKDKWSYITSQEAFTQYYEEGTYIGYGFSYTLDAENNVRITFLFDDSDFNTVGVQRGWIIKKINGSIVDGNLNLGGFLGNNAIGVSNEFEFETPAGGDTTFTFEKKLIAMNTVGYDKVYDVGTNKVGYFVFKSFIGPSIAELTETFNSFLTEGVNELIIDLRYNGGGQLNVVEHIANHIIPDNVNGELLVKIEHNTDRSGENNSKYFIQNGSSLKLNKVYFITSKGSASASEVIINSLDPFIDVFIVGDDTYGKPVGMYAFESRINNMVYVPISFKLVNAVGFGGYYNGLTADSYVSDDISSNFGIGEAIFDEVIYHIENGSFSSSKSSEEIFRRPFKEIRNIKDELGAI